ncbi:MAG TPA: S41 family peptidase [Stellaceae bacterium]|nr:S41 family peptidase [Stellaceae bacterium]
MSNRLPLPVAVLLGAALTVIPLLCCDPAEAGTAAAAVPRSDLTLIGRVMRRVETDYLRPVQADALTTNALKGMLSRLDPHSSYLDPQEYRDVMADMHGKFGGIGLRMSEKAGVPMVISPIAGTPAARAHLEPGDLITAIDGHATDGMDLERAVDRLRGRPGTKVTLTIARENAAPFVVTLTRRVIRIATVKSKLEPKRVGYVRITEFGAATPAALKHAIMAMKRDAGGHLDGFVLDLRDDPGGLLDAAVAVAGDFLDGGTVVTTRGRMSDDDETFTASAAGDLIARTPMVVLINSASASASEIVAGALQDRHRATVMGTRSFGKGSVQTIIPLNSGGALRLTTALYYTPSGRSIQGRGITPNIVVAAPADEQVANAVVIRESDLHGALVTEGGTLPAAAAQEYSHPIRFDLIGTGRDGQLKAALGHFEAGVAGRRTGH